MVMEILLVLLVVFVLGMIMFLVLCESCLINEVIKNIFRCKYNNVLFCLFLNVDEGFFCNVFFLFFFDVKFYIEDICVIFVIIGFSKR